MKRQNIISISFWIISVLIPQGLYAFENQRTHPAITERAAINTASILDDYLKTQVGMNDGINTQLSYNFPSEIQTRIDRAHWDSGRTQRPVLEWLRVGSAIEDTDEYPIYSIRPRHHFYDPNRNAGLNNKDDNPYWIGWPEIAMGLRGSSALVWAVNGTALQEPTTNEQSWQSARNDFYHSLTESAKNDREKYLAMTFLDLGCTLHMVEDMGVPAHTRNDFLFAHYRSSLPRDWGEPLEMWAEGQVAAADDNIPSNWLTGWTPAPKVYSKVSGYFDTDTRNATDYLGDGVSPPATWGLAEATNYQFFSWSTITPLTSSLYYFPHPDIEHHCDTREESGWTYLYGYAVDHLAKFTMSEDFLQHGHLEQAWCTLGEAIYNDYVRITIPRTIDYATGLTNYFFRGRLSATAQCIDCNSFEITITNQSSNSGVQQTLKGGTFELYWDDSSGSRTPVYDFVVDGWGSGSTLAYGASITAVFTKPEGEVEGYILVYKGNICANPADPDTDDENAIAIAVTTCSEDCCKHYTYAGITKPSSSHKAQRGIADFSSDMIENGNFPVREGTLDWHGGLYEAPTLFYSHLTGSDDAYWGESPYNTAYNAAFLFEFYIIQNRDFITQLEVDVEIGVAYPYSYGGMVYLWNYNTSTYLVLGFTPNVPDTRIKATVIDKHIVVQLYLGGTDTLLETLLDETIDADIKDFIDSSTGQVTIFVVNPKKGSDFHIPEYPSLGGLIDVDDVYVIVCSVPP